MVKARGISCQIKLDFPILYIMNSKIYLEQVAVNV
jgi:hypothetical protein